MNRHRLGALAAILYSLNAYPQTPGQPVPSKPDYSQEAFVLEQLSEEFVFENDGTSTHSGQARIRIQSDAGVQQYAVLTFPYQALSESFDIDYVRVRKPDNSVVVTPPDSIQDLPSQVTQQAPQYSDAHEKHVAVKGLAVGDVLEFEERWHTIHPLIPGQFWLTYEFATDPIILNESLKVSVPASRPVKWTSPEIKPAISESGDRRIFLWTSSHLVHKTKEQEQLEQEKLVYAAAQGLVPQPRIQLSSFQSWAEVGRWYGNLQEERVKPGPEVTAKAVELTKGLSDDQAKAKALYNYVSNQIHYIGVDFGIGRYQPHPAAEVLSNQYGDCKDKHTLLAAMLAAVNIRSYPALISSSHTLTPEVPSPAQFDHVITAVQSGDTLTWLDTTPEVAPFSYLLSGLRGKNALLVYTDKEPALILTPAKTAKAIESFRIDSKLDDKGTLTGTIEQTEQGGDTEVVMRSVFRRVPQPKWKDAVQAISYATGFAGEVSNVTVTSLDKTDEPIGFKYTYLRKDLVDMTDLHIPAPLPVIGLKVFSEKDPKPSTPIWLGESTELRYESYVEIPKGYRAAVPIRELDLHESFADYHRAVFYKDHILTTQRQLTLKLREVADSDFEKYKKFSQAILDDYNSKIRLVSTSAHDSYQNEIWELPFSDISEANRDYDDARAKYDKQDYQGQLAAVKRAVEADPKFVRAWLWLGEIHKSMGRSDQALDAYKKAIALDPKIAVSYKAEGFTLLQMKKPEEALAVWQQLSKAVPDDADGPRGTGEAMFALKRYSEARSAFEAALLIDPDAPIQYQLATSCLRSGQTEEAITRYKKVAEQFPTAIMLNRIAYELAEANQGLDVALDYARKAVAQANAASVKINLANLQPEDLQNPRDLAADWDTLGWVYFRMGKLSEAKGYLTAAWSTMQNGEVADHLAELYEKQDNKKPAIDMYRFALNRLLGQAGADADEISKVRERLENLSPGTANSISASSVEITGKLSDLRTTKLPSVSSKEGSAEFFITLARNEKTSQVVVDAVKFVSGSEDLRAPAETALKMTNPGVQLPPEGNPRVLRRGVLACTAAAGCSLTLLDPMHVLSVN